MPTSSGTIEFLGHMANESFRIIFVPIEWFKCSPKTHHLI
jgi:hypothetical protein